MTSPNAVFNTDGVIDIYSQIYKRSHIYFNTIMIVKTTCHISLILVCTLH